MASHIVVKGIPVSINSSTLSKNTWKNKVANAARQEFNASLSENDLKVKITIFYDGVPTCDADNASKPICDALCNVAYNDDSQIMDRNLRMRSLDGAYTIENVPPKVASALGEKEAFVWIEISRVGSEVTNL